MSKQSELDILYSKWFNCTKCSICKEGRKQLVFSDGSPDAELMIIGEGPGRDEDQQGLPFVGPAGKKMDQIFKLAGFERDQIFWTNVVHCRPKDNRTPNDTEASICKNMALEEIHIIRPKVIVLAGRVAAMAFLNFKGTSSMKSIVERWSTIEGIPCITIYHPAALLHAIYEPSKRMVYKKSIWRAMIDIKIKLAILKQAQQQTLGMI
jgi:DNA polymerase